MQGSDSPVPRTQIDDRNPYVYHVAKQTAGTMPREKIELDDLQVIEIKRGSRWIKVELGGGKDSREAKVQVATVSVPASIWLKRWFGHYQNLYVVLT